MLHRRQPTPNFDRNLAREQLHLLAMRSDWDGVKAELAKAPTNEREFLVCTPYHADTENTKLVKGSLLARWLIQTDSNRFDFLTKGVDLTKFPEENIIIRDHKLRTCHNYTLAQTACTFGNFTQVRKLAKLGVDLAKPNSDGITPLASMLEDRIKVLPPKLIKKILSYYSDLNLKTRSGLSILTLAIQNFDADLGFKILQTGKQTSEDTQGKSFEIYEFDWQREDRPSVRKRQVGFREMANKLLEDLHTLDDDSHFDQISTYQELRQNLQRHPSIYYAYLYVTSHRDAVLHHLNSQGDAFVRLMMHTFTQLEGDSLRGLFSVIEATMDYYYYDEKKRPQHHPNEAEFMAMLSHPSYPGYSSELSFVTEVLTSPYRWMDLGVESVRPEDLPALECWRQFGAITHSFSLLKHYTRQPVDLDENWVPNNSILENYGYTRLNRMTEEQDEKYGAGFVLLPGTKNFSYRPFHLLPMAPNEEQAPKLMPLDSKTLIVVNRSHYLISHPNHGTLIIRNSSPIFGRDRFSHPAYWSNYGVDNGFSIEALTTDFDFAYLKEYFKPILVPEINGIDPEYASEAQEMTAAPHHQSIDSLLDYFYDDELLQDDVDDFFYVDEHHYETSDGTIITQSNQHFLFLTTEMTGALDHLHSWVFNTKSYSAFADPKQGAAKGNLVGAYNSPGFPHLVNYLTSVVEQHGIDSALGAENLKLPGLAFVSPRRPAWNYFPYSYQDNEGQEHRATTLVVDEEIIACFAALVEGKRLPNHELAYRKIQAFFQSGLLHEGNLLVI